MRLHRLTVTAFGPFADTIDVDFDDLGAGGLFLLTGATGSGKSSILDAVCFGLYGEVPGDRHIAKHLRSDLAPPGRAPEVVLEATIDGRRLRLTRSPAWDRPKRRGSGLVRVQAHVVVEEQTGTGWVGHTHRLDEAGHLVTELLGMTCAQFTQVALLPQGRFQAFLRSSATERHAVLQRLFRTRRFEDVESWLSRHRREVAAQSREHCAVVTGLVNRLREAGGSETPDSWDLGDLACVADQLTPWGTDLEADLSERCTRAGEVAVATQSALAAATEALAQAKAQVAARGRGERAAAVLLTQRQTQVEAATLEEAVRAHDHAAPVGRLAAQTDRARSALEHSLRVAQSLTAGLVSPELVGPGGEVSVEALNHAHATVTAVRATLRAWLPRELELLAHQATLAQVEADSVQVGDAMAELETEAERLPAALFEARGHLETLEALLTRNAGDLVAERESAAALAAAELVEVLVLEQEQAQRTRREAKDLTLTLKETWLRLKDERIAGMAGELARDLAAGCQCPVCGSADHPAPAQPTASSTRVEEESARRAYETASVAEQVCSESLAAVDSRLDQARDRSGGRDVGAWTAEHRSATVALEESAAAGPELTRARERCTSLSDRVHALAAEQTRARDRLSGLVTEQVRLEGVIGSLLAQRTELLAGRGDTTPDQLVEEHTQTLLDLARGREAVSLADAARRSVRDAEASADGAAVDAGFASVEEALAGVLPARERSHAGEQLEARRVVAIEAEAVLAEKAVSDALQDPLADLTELRDGVQRAASARDLAHAELARLELARHRAAELVAALAEEVRAWIPVLVKLEVATCVSSLAEGTAADNTLRMRLSAYVLGERLRQVVASANERLAVMTEHRYLLEQSDEKGAGERRGGLSLLVRDQWSGSTRDPATLSGGETFVVSLALALGLADTVTHEAGGTRVETLFVDEGFGSLDADTLDTVMDTLDSLRDSGRVVGIVSHVAELRSRVTSQLHVVKGRGGGSVIAAPGRALPGPH